MTKKSTLKLSPSGSIAKEDFMEMWKGLKAGGKISPDPIPYKHKGTTIDEDGIRICGSMEFIQSILSHLKPLLEFEDVATRIGVACSEITNKENGHRIKGKYRCAIQVHQRGREGAMLQAYMKQFATKKA